MPAFNQFISWKRRKGLNAGVVCKEDICADQMAANGDTRSQINDSAGKLRQYLRAVYTSNKSNGIGSTYVLLGGDYSIVPVRYGCGAENTWTTFTPNDSKIPSDLYYSDLYGNWNVDKDTFYGEFTGIIMANMVYGDSVDYGPEIFVGRLLCTSAQEVNTWTAKELLYEQNPGNGDYSYLAKSLFTEADSVGYMDFSALPTMLISYGYDKLSESPYDLAPAPTAPTGSTVINKLNTHYGFCSFSNHGLPDATGLQLASKGDNQGWVYGIRSFDSYDAEPNNGFDDLTNYNYPTIAYSASCDNMPFDTYLTPKGQRNLGAAFTVLNNGGGPAYLGNTRWLDYVCNGFGN